MVLDTKTLTANLTDFREVGSSPEWSTRIGIAPETIADNRMAITPFHLPRRPSSPTTCKGLAP